MSHQVIITFDLDENKVQENAEKEAGRQIAREVLEEVFGKEHAYDRRLRIKNCVYEAVKGAIEEDKDKIIEAAIAELTKSLARTRIVKERMQEALNE